MAIRKRVILAEGASHRQNYAANGTSSYCSNRCSFAQSCNVIAADDPGLVPATRKTDPAHVEACSNRLTSCAHPKCRHLFSVCSRCDRGCRYCSKECAVLARRARQRLASRVYQASERGRRNHAERQARYRSRQPAVTHRSGSRSRPGDFKSGAASPGQASPPARRGSIAVSCGRPLQPPVNSCVTCQRQTTFLRQGPLRRRPRRMGRGSQQTRTRHVFPVRAPQPNFRGFS